VLLQAGLAALKVPQSLEEGTNKEDPLHLDDFRRLAAALPFSKHVHSKLVCAITRAPMNEHNPPMVRRAWRLVCLFVVNDQAIDTEVSSNHCLDKLGAHWQLGKLVAR
jgi:hypothetical protein